MPGFFLPMEFILAKPKHEDQFLEMMEDFYEINNYQFNWSGAADNFKEFIQNENLGKLWFIGHSDHIIGYLILTFGYSFEYGGRDAFLDELYLKEEYRNQGYGSIIMETLDFLAAKEGVKAIHLEVEKTNSAGNELYYKSGYTDSDRSLLSKRIS